MMAIPFMRAGGDEDVIAWYGGERITRARFWRDVGALAARLPDRAYVLNHCENRYHFLVGFAAGLARRQISLFPSSTAPQVLEQLSRDYPGAYCVSDRAPPPAGMEQIAYRPAPETASSMPALDGLAIPYHQVAAIVFTSGSTGIPKPYPKSWGAVTHETRIAARSLGLKEGPGYVVATVPPQHMYGFIYSAILPLQFGYAIGAERPFYPEDIRKALESYPQPAILVTTPVHVRALVKERVRLPALNFILSATAPLSTALAQEAETLFHTRVLEIYGSTETASIAARHTVATEVWRTFDDIRVSMGARGFCVEAPYFPQLMVLTDTVEVRGEREFLLFGRDADLIKIGGKRASLSELTRYLLEIDGVSDGTFFFPDGEDGREPRLTAFVVAPGKTREEIMQALRQRIDPVFLPRPLRLVSALPRNATGKLPRGNLMRLLKEGEKELLN